jgi:hypothetical protein
MTVYEPGQEWLDSIGHIIKMDQGKAFKKVFESQLEGRPRLRWLEDVEKNLKEVKVKRYEQKAFNREEWVSMIKKTQAVRGP